MPDHPRTKEIFEQRVTHYKRASIVVQQYNDTARELKAFLESVAAHYPDFAREIISNRTIVKFDNAAHCLIEVLIDCQQDTEAIFKAIVQDLEDFEADLAKMEETHA